MQTTINFQELREVKINTLKSLQDIIKSVLWTHEELRDIKHTNALVRHIWKHYGDYSCDSITRLARKIKAENPELDSSFNELNRANMETAYHDYLR